MLELFHQHMNALTTPLSGGDPLSKGMITVWALTVLGYLSRSIPRRIYQYIRRQTTVTATLIKDKTGSNIEFFIKFENWLHRTNTMPVRRVSVNPKTSTRKTTLGFAYGTHLVRCEGRFYLITKTKLDNDGEGMVLEMMQVTTLGRSAAILEECFLKLTEKDIVRHYWTTPRSSYELWAKLNPIESTPTIFFDKKLKKRIDTALDFMMNNKSWYTERSIPRKLTFVFHGSPGTGKSSLTRYIADKVGADIYSLNFNASSSTNMLAYMSAVTRSNPDRIAVVTIEDFDTFGGLSKRDKDDKNEDKKFSVVDMSAFLNTLQGLVPLENIIVVMTTNHIEKIDDAILRKGRVDFCEEVKSLTLENVREHFEYVYKLPFPATIEHIDPIKACDMQALFLENPMNPQAYLQAITKTTDIDINHIVQTTATS